MKTTLNILPILFLLTGLNASAASKSLAERVVTMNTKIAVDEEYNKALDEMQDLAEPAKIKLAKELGVILVKDKSEERRANAASALGDICGAVKTNIDFLSKSYQDKSKFVRQATASALKRCGPSHPIVTATLKKMLKDKDKTVQAMAQSTLEEFGVK